MASFGGFSVSITREEFHLFHSIDRQVYATLIQNLGRNPGESMRVIALWLWLEHNDYCHNLVVELLKWPAFMINAMANETVACLNCMDHVDDDEVMVISTISSHNNFIPLVKSFTKGAISLGFFHKNKITVIQGVSEVLDQVCSRAFDDILPNQVDVGKGILMDADTQTCLSFTKIPVRPGERTVFLTFSNGYPVSKNELNNFFTSKYGDDIVESIHMQGVSYATEQSLYARVVLRSASIIPVILNGNKTAKFSINRKHVRARKFVPNYSGSPLKSLSSSWADLVRV